MHRRNFDDFFKTQITSLNHHWSTFEEENDKQQAEIAQYSVSTALERFIRELKQLPQNPSENVVLAKIKELFDLLDQINNTTNYCLSDSNLSDVLVPFVCKAVEMAGLDLGNYVDRDPTMAFRRF